MQEKLENIYMDLVFVAKEKMNTRAGFEQKAKNIQRNDSRYI